MSLVLSIFPGLDLFGHAFEEEGFCVVRGPDMILGGDIRTFHPPPGRFDGVIGGDPCQSHSSLANLVRAKGLEPSFPDMTGEYQRVIEEAQPRWFLRANVPRAPDVKPTGYDVRSFLLDNWSSFGEEQQRRRRFWFGVRDGVCPELRRWMEFALEIPGEPVHGGHDATLGNRITERSRKAATAADGRRGHREGRKSPVTWRHEGRVGSPEKDYSTRYTLNEMIELQGLPADFLDRTPFTVQGLRKMIGNGVAVPTGRQLARAIRCAMEGA